MKTLFQTALKFVAPLLLLLVTMGVSARAQEARLQLTNLDYLAGKASETVNVDIDEKVLHLTASFFGNSAEEKEVKALINGLKGIYVRSFEFEREGEYTSADVEAIRAQLKTQPGPGLSAW